MTHEADEDDPHDESTHWIGQIPKEDTDSNERTDKRSTRRSEQPNIQRKKLPVAKRKET